MDLIVEPQKGKAFVVEVGFFDTVLEIKQKIHKYHDIPVADQTLVFQTQVMADDRDVRHYDLLHNSRVSLLSGAGVITVSVRIPAPQRARKVALEIGAEETVLALKERFREAAGAVAEGRTVAVHWKGAEVAEQRTLRECGIGEGAEVEAILGRRTMRVTVVGKCGTKKVVVEVSPSDKVGELRKELQKLRNFHLPPDGYFFIHKQTVLDDDHSFRWNDVVSGDTIEIFNGTVTGGS